MSVNIEVTFDFVCPWCYIGVKRLMRAIEGLSDDFDWNLSWKPYEINPKLPAAGVDRASYRATKYGEARGRMVDAQVEAQARYDGVQIDMNSIGIMANSRLAHRLRLLAKEKNLERRYIHAVYKAYFEAGINIGIEAELVRIAESVRIDADHARRYLRDISSDERVVMLEEEARANGVHEVPHFLIGTIPVTGAIPWTAIKETLVRAADSDLPPPGQGFCAPDDEDCAGSS